MKDYRDIPVEQLALQLSGRKDLDTAFILRQVEGYQRLRTKVPTWASMDELHYPPRISLEQCSGEAAARYKAEVVRFLLGGQRGKRMIDLTGGLGVDFSFIAPLFDEAEYVERSPELCTLARHNFPLLGLHGFTVTEGDGTERLRTMIPADLIFLDPARRDGAGRKTVRLEDCDPNVLTLLPLLREKARYVVLKLSPMLDIADSLRSLGCVSEVHVVSIGRECKDLLLIIDNEAEGDSRPRIIAAEDDKRLVFTHEEEEQTTAPQATTIGTYLYEPGPAVLKSGAFKTIARRYDLEKLHPSAHLYTAERLVEDFPGRSFLVEQTFSFNKAGLADLRRRVQKANLTLRGFPAEIETLRKKLKIKEGGEDYLFATTLFPDTHLLILCRKA